MNAIERILNRGVEEIIVKSHLERALRSGKKLRVKLGIDPTAPDLHLGHTTVLRKLRQFQDLGHKAVLIIGDFTAQIGDPSGQSKERKPLSEKEVKQNEKKYLKQAAKVIDVKKAEIKHNSQWHKKGLKQLLELAKSASVSQVLKRDEFEKRLSSGGDVSILETLYPLLQGYDSVAVKADVELGGTDQKFNLLMGRRVQRHFNMPEQDILTVPLIEGTDGVKKMSKSLGNYIKMEEKPDSMFGKIMSIPDKLISKYFETLTDLDPPKEKPRDQKLLLAETIVTMYHSQKEAAQAKENFIKIFSKKEIPENIPQLSVISYQLSVIDLLLKAGVKSKSEARRLVKQGGVKINGKTKNNPDESLILRGGETLKIGKHRFFKVVK